MEKDEIKVMAEATAAEAQVGIKKAEALQKSWRKTKSKDLASRISKTMYIRMHSVAISR